MRTRFSRLFERQGYHVLGIVLLIAAAWALLRVDTMRAGRFAGLSSADWVALAVAVPVIHQLYVAVIWRLQLEFGNARNGERSVSFRAYTVGFFVLFVARMATTVALALSNAERMDLPALLRAPLAAALMILTAYVLYSVVAHFGVIRAAGADHFDHSYRSKPLVRKGIFRYTGNAMYTFGLLALWIPGILLASPAALVTGILQHAYIWVHYFCTELPDMRRIYSGSAAD